MNNMEIMPEYTGTDPNLHPAASAFARLVKSITNTDGTFTDPDLEEEFQAWQREQKKPADGTSVSGKGFLSKRKETTHEL